MSRWHNTTPRSVDTPEPGFFRMRLVRGGPWVAAELRRDADGAWTALIDGVPSQPSSPDPAVAADVFRIWHGAEAVTASEHAYLIERAAWARQHSPDSPEATPRQPIRLGRLPPVF